MTDRDGWRKRVKMRIDDDDDDDDDNDIINIKQEKIRLRKHSYKEISKILIRNTFPKIENAYVQDKEKTTRVDFLFRGQSFHKHGV